MSLELFQIDKKVRYSTVNDECVPLARQLLLYVMIYTNDEFYQLSSFSLSGNIPMYQSSITSSDEFLC